MSHGSPEIYFYTGVNLSVGASHHVDSQLSFIVGGDPVLNESSLAVFYVLSLPCNLRFYIFSQLFLSSVEITVVFSPSV